MAPILPRRGTSRTAPTLTVAVRSSTPALLLIAIVFAACAPAQSVPATSAKPTVSREDPPHESPVTPAVSRQETADARMRRLLGNLGERCISGDGTGTPRLDVAPQGLTSSELASLSHSQGATTTQASPRDTAAINDLTALAELADIDIAQYRPSTRELFLLGPASQGGDGLRFDDWIAAVRAVGVVGFPGVSIDPGNDASLMQVRYFGGIENHHMGANFFEADRTLKMLSTGYDNRNCLKWADRPTSVPTELDLMDEEIRGFAGLADRGWHRYWFEASDEKLQEEGTTVRFPTRRLVIKSESVPAGRESATARAFAQALSSNFPDIMERIPSFRELHREAVLVSLAKWMLDRHIPVDREWIGSTSTGPTPRNTPSITVLHSSVMDRVYLEYGIHGGVDFQKPNSYVKRGGTVSALASAITKRPTGARSWVTMRNGRPYRVVALRIRNPTVLSGGERWTRLAVLLPQPMVQRFGIPSDFAAYFAQIDIVNNTNASVSVRLSGPVSDSFTIPSMSRHQIGVTPGAYAIATRARCGARTDRVNVPAGAISTQTYVCTQAP